jgi:preprotein translocase subunit SecG
VAAEKLTRSQCHPKVIGELNSNLQSVCGTVYAQSLQSAMLIMSTLYIACALFFVLTWRRLGKDMVDRN